MQEERKTRESKEKEAEDQARRKEKAQKAKHEAVETSIGNLNLNRRLENSLDEKGEKSARSEEERRRQEAADCGQGERGGCARSAL